jgi:hypothetical protein
LVSSLTSSAWPPPSRVTSLLHQQVAAAPSGVGLPPHPFWSWSGWAPSPSTRPLPPHPPGSRSAGIRVFSRAGRWYLPYYGGPPALVLSRACRAGSLPPNLAPLPRRLSQPTTPHPRTRTRPQPRPCPRPRPRPPSRPPSPAVIFTPVLSSPISMCTLGVCSPSHPGSVHLGLDWPPLP